MKKIMVLTVALFAMSSVFAADGMGKMGKMGAEGMGEGPMCHHQMPDLSSLNLTQEQKAKMDALRQKHMAEKKSMREKHQSEMKAIMTAEQWAKFEQMKPKMHKDGGMMGDGMKDHMKKGMKGTEAPANPQ